jgi:DNA-binding NarL/FixJ family response regulator
VDDHELLRDALRQLLDVEEDLVVVGDVSDGDRGVSVARRVRPDVILLDVEIPGDDVRITVDRILRELPDAAIIILSMYDEPRVVRDLLDRGVRGYLLKSVTREELVSAIRAARDQPDRVVLSLSPDTLARQQGGSGSPLSGREVELLNLVALAYSNSEIASELCLTEGTVKQHMRRIFTKLGAVSRIDAVNKAVAASILKPPGRLPGSKAHPADPED